MTVLVHTAKPRVAARVNWGRWVIDCPRCPNALTLPPSTAMFFCDQCEARAEAVWPDEEMRYGIARLLSMRPNVTTRNWEPGETLTQLIMENGAHGILAPLLTESDPGAILITVNDHTIARDLLPVTGQMRKEVTA